MLEQHNLFFDKILRTLIIGFDDNKMNNFMFPIKQLGGLVCIIYEYSKNIITNDLRKEEQFVLYLVEYSVYSNWIYFKLRSDLTDLIKDIDTVIDCLDLTTVVNLTKKKDPKLINWINYQRIKLTFIKALELSKVENLIIIENLLQERQFVNLQYFRKLKTWSKKYYRQRLLLLNCCSGLLFLTVL